MDFQPADFESLSCDLCGADAPRLRYEKRGFRIVECSRCGMVYTNPRLKGAKIGELYDADYFQGHGFDQSVNYVRDVDEFGEHKASYDLHDWDLDTIQTMLAKPSARSLLEIGCGTGVFLAKAKAHGFDVHGLELSEYAAGFVRNMGIPVDTKSIEDADFPQNSWDVIVMREVIEHLPHPLESLKTIHGWLKPGGVLFMATGNYNCPERKIKGKDWFYFMPEGHLYYFSNRTMRKYLRTAGFRTIRVTNQGDMLMELLRKRGILEAGQAAPRNAVKRLVFYLVRAVNHFISSGMRVYAVK
ncbi:MAG: class I SAM-dependent methyltransferase [Bacteroidota bacterium]|nr:class I SAM-dependent methyltransferase [Bacteroidota bacterium]MDP4232925.1 class I SAM-dependent methyltransferase [Bacteroidota bacterium]MDP4241969.1 class I SAM-dependent methyltransferase [Bacteroidota bacterium]MDP4286872.1 class I SAM-dependent methyltransferase [Bacteroidota bacterium]